MLGELRNVSTWMLDGTFKVVPSLFFQLYTIHAIRGSHVFPCVYVLLPNKATATYKRQFQILKGAQNDLNSQICITDLERAAVNALCEEFHGVSVQVCFFSLVTGHLEIDSTPSSYQCLLRVAWSSYCPEESLFTCFFTSQGSSWRIWAIRGYFGGYRSGYIRCLHLLWRYIYRPTNITVAKP